jgi:aminoglycoside 3-N-acetyltransferase
MKRLYPCGPGSPFDKLLEVKGKILFVDVGFGAITFFHYVEELVKNKLPFPVYEDRLFSVAVIDGKDERHEVRTYAFTKGVLRDTAKLEQEMIRRRKMIKGKVGNTRLILVTAEDVVSAMTGMVDAGDFPYGTVGRT